MGAQLTELPGVRATAIKDPQPVRLGRYRLLQPIGEGGMAVVHLAVGPDDRMVAVKALRRPDSESADARCRLAREVRALRRVSSPFVAEVIDADVTGDVPYIVMRLVQGRTLAQVVAEQGPLCGWALQRLAYGLADGLAAVHDAGVVHRDLKPGNVMMAGGDPVLIDFGIACQAGESPLTETGTYLGTPGYLAPEVIEGQRARAPADVHAWGVTVGFAARGEPVYGTGSYSTVLSRIVRAEASLDGIHGALYPVVAAALLRQPGQRPSAAWLAREVSRLDLTVPAAPPSTLSAPVNGGKVTEALRTRFQRRLRQGISYKPSQNLVDVLPAVRYAPSPETVPPTGYASPVGAPRLHPALAFAALALAVTASYVMPVAGTLTVTALLTLLRAGNKARTGLASHRGVRGPRAWDMPRLACSVPWVVARSVIETVLLAPLVLAAAGVAVVSVAFVAGRANMLAAWAAVGTTYTVLSCLGPRSRAARNELHRVINVVAASPLAAAVAMLTLALLAAIIAGLAVTQALPTWPLPNLPGLHIHLGQLNYPGLLRH